MSDRARDWLRRYVDAPTEITAPPGCMDEIVDGDALIARTSLAVTTRPEVSDGAVGEKAPGYPNGKEQP